MTAADRRPFVVVAYVLAFHALALWALQSGLLRKAVEIVVPVQMLSEFIEPPAPRETPPAPPVVVKRPVTQPKAPVVPQTLAVRAQTPTPEAWTVPVVPAAPAAPIAAPVEPSPPAPAAPPAPPTVVLPSSDADYLQNPKPVYPSASKRRGEQGLVIHSVLIGTDGLPVSARLVKSSGFDALDQAALTAVMRWRYIPGKRNGVPTTMSFNVPINWVLE
jgi:protein TonB